MPKPQERKVKKSYANKPIARHLDRGDFRWTCCNKPRQTTFCPECGKKRPDNVTGLEQRARELCVMYDSKMRALHTAAQTFLERADERQRQLNEAAGSYKKMASLFIEWNHHNNMPSDQQWLLHDLQADIDYILKQRDSVMERRQAVSRWRAVITDMAAKLGFGEM